MKKLFVKIARVASDSVVRGLEEIRSEEVEIRSRIEAGAEDRTLREILANPELRKGSPAQVEARLRRLLQRRLKENASVIAAGIKAVAEVGVLLLKLGDLKQQREAAQKRARKTRASDPITPDEEHFIRRQRALGVTPSMYSQLTQPEDALLANLFKEKVQDPSHGVPDGLWGRLWRAGLIDLPIKNLSVQERKALLVLMSMPTDEERLAWQVLSELAGRSLDEITPQLAFALLERLRLDLEEHSDGLWQQLKRAQNEEWMRDVEFILETLGIDHGDRRVHQLLKPETISRLQLLERQKKEVAEATARARAAEVDKFQAIAEAIIRASNNDKDYWWEKWFIDPDTGEKRELDTILQKARGSLNEEEFVKFSSIIEGMLEAEEYRRARDELAAQHARGLASLLVDFPEMRTWAAQMGYVIPEDYRDKDAVAADADREGYADYYELEATHSALSEASGAALKDIWRKGRSL